MPKTSSRTRMGTPRKPLIGGWPSGNPTERGSVAEVLEPDRPGVLDQRPEQALALGEATDRVDRRVVHADVDELLEAGAVGRDHAQGAVRRVDELARGLDDPAQHGLEVEDADDGALGAQQFAQPRDRPRSHPPGRPSRDEGTGTRDARHGYSPDAANERVPVGPRAA